MRSSKPHAAQARQAGFSMVEMLMTAFVLAVGILGLTMLQAMSLKATRGSKSMSAAILVAEQVMDRVEMEGRLTWLNLSANLSVIGTVPNLKYITAATVSPAVVSETFTIKGMRTDATATDPIDSTTFYTVTTTRTVADAASTGRLSDVSVRVVFSDSVNGSNVAIPRELSLTRRIVHG